MEFPSRIKKYSIKRNIEYSIKVRNSQTETRLEKCSIWTMHKLSIWTIDSQKLSISFSNWKFFQFSIRMSSKFSIPFFTFNFNFLGKFEVPIYLFNFQFLQQLLMPFFNSIFSSMFNFNLCEYFQNQFLIFNFNCSNNFNFNS